MYDFKNFHQHCLSLSQEQFCKKFPKPILVIGKRPKPQYEKKVDLMRTQAITTYNSPLVFRGFRLGYPPKYKCLVYCFDQRKTVTIGRTNNNDITLRDDSVSKAHAYFKSRSTFTGFFLQKNKETWNVVDMGSENGTFVNGEFLEENDSHIVEDKTNIVFGAYYFATFFMPKSCYEYIRSLS
ncbi:FHA domain-containing protein [Candidatus Uabimicrobium sp. HlEnr_7]|uniref:FHA domain-containing protein n=1 Tax=Candidatus Uabimicrobium helgolandensis TaxID=3095367 RepID=UPI003555E462